MKSDRNIQKRTQRNFFQIQPTQKKKKYFCRLFSISLQLDFRLKSYLFNSILQL